MCADANAALVVDDDPALLSLVAGILQARGYCVTREETTEGALRRLSAQRFRLAVFDVTLADGSGLDLLRDAEPHLGGATVLVMSGDPSWEGAALAAGAAAFLPKPGLVPALEQALRGRQERATDR